MLVQVRFFRALHDFSEHFLLHIDDIQSSRWRQCRGHRHAMEAEPRSDLQNSFPVVWFEKATEMHG